MNHPPAFIPHPSYFSPMRIILVKPCWKYPIAGADHTYNRRWPPLELLYCGAILEAQGHQVSVIDAQAQGLTPAEVAARAGSADAALVTSSALDRWQCPSLELGPVEAVARELRGRVAQLWLTGYHGTVRPEVMLQRTGVDVVVRGEPELTVRDLAAGRAWEEIPGLTFRRHEQIVVTPQRPWLDMADLPVPAFHLIDLKHYNYEILGPRLMILEGARGCPYACTFCTRAMQGKRLRRKSIEQLGQEVEVAVGRFGARSIYFIDLEFTACRELAEGISQYILDRRISVRWCCQTRCDKVDEPLLRLMRRAGCRLIHFGIETGSPRIAELMRKEIAFDQQRRGIELARRVGMEVLGFFLLGYPGETDEEMRQTVRLARELNPTYASFHRISPYPDTAIYGQCTAAGEDECELFPAFAGSPDERRKVDQLVRDAVWSYYMRPRYMLSRLLHGSPRSLWQQFRLFLGYFSGPR